MDACLSPQEIGWKFPILLLFNRQNATGEQRQPLEESLWPEVMGKNKELVEEYIARLRVRRYKFAPDSE
jgi:hypothetical protein